jgi:hypothetical protein
VIVDRTTARSIADASTPKAGGLDRPNGATDRIPPWPLLILTTTVALLALATALVAIRTGGRGLISLALATFLCAFFVVFAVLFSELELFGPLRPWMAMLLFAASVASFKLMGLYDSAGRPRRG